MRRAPPTSARLLRRAAGGGRDVQIAARLGLSRLALATGDARTARTQALQALEREPALAEIPATLGRWYAASEQWDDGARRLRTGRWWPAPAGPGRAAS